jgi:plastocyanin
MKSVRIAVVCLLFTFGLAFNPAGAPTHAQSTAVVINIQNFAFSPATMTVTAGSTVVWANHDSTDHTSTSDTGVWDVSDIPGGASSSGTVFNTPGTYAYHCNIHPFMTGTIVVVASGPAATATPVPTTPPAPPASTSTPVPTLGSVAATATPQPTATSTAVPLFLKLAVGHKTVKAGAKQSVKVTTVAGAAIGITVTFPVGAKKHRTAIAPASGTFTWNFKQPGGRTTKTKHTAKVAVTVSQGTGSSKKANKTYTIR